MNEIHDRNDDMRFDRLVDGEMSAEEYRSTLAGLDDEPGEWRRCAMAFLEAQALKQDLGDLRESAVCTHTQQAAPAKASLPKASLTFAKYWPMLLAMAASFLVAFGLGYAWRAPWSAAGQQPEFIV